jgi:hypothetical protein
VREAHFTAKTPATKRKYREQDARLRGEIAALLQQGGWPDDVARKLAAWDPYDQNASADFFDPEWMFGIRDGFDIVIGNPPYVRIQTLHDIDANLVRYLKDHYAVTKKGNYDLYVAFVEAGLKLLSKHGELAYILPHKFFNAQYGQPLRKLLSDGRHLRHVVHFGDQQIFPGATNYVCLLFLSKAGVEHCRWVRADSLADWLATLRAPETTLPAARFTPAEWNVAVGSGSRLFHKLQDMPVKLGNISQRIFQGLVTGADSVFVLRNVGEGRFFSDATEKEHHLEPGLLHPVCKGSLDIRRYHIDATSRSILFPYRVSSGQAVLINHQEFEVKFPKVWEYLQACRDILKNREGGRWNHEGWYAFSRSQNLRQMEQFKILTPSIASSPSFALDANGTYYFMGSGGGGGGGYGITLRDNCGLAMSYVLALLNSRLLDWMHRRLSTPYRGGYLAYNRQYIEPLPIRPINFDDASERAEHDAIVKLVERILAAKRADPNADTSAWEREIDERVYRLYGLTPEEIKIVEEDAR